MSYGKIEIDKKFFDDFANYINATSDAVDKTIKDGSRRAPGWVSQEVMKYYNFKKGDITPTGKGIAKRGANGQVLKDAAGETKRLKKAGSVSAHGGTISTFQLTYKGRLLTPLHFGMTPKAPNPNGYTLRMTVRKGQRKTIGRYRKTREKGGPYSGGTGAILMRTRYGDIIPMQREGPGKDAKVKGFKSTSVPQAIDSKDVKPKIEDRVTKEMMKRLEHNMSRI